MSSNAKIGSDLEALNLTSWIATAYFLTLTSFQPLYGKLSDIFSRKTCLLFAYGIFGLGCLACGLAGDIYHFIAARVFQGIGGGGMTTVVSILMSDIVPLKDRGVWRKEPPRAYVYLFILFRSARYLGVRWIHLSRMFKIGCLYQAATCA